MSKYKYSRKSLERLKTCDKKIRNLMIFALENSKFDITIACGFRSDIDQQLAFQQGKSKAKWGESKHNTFPSKAIDIYPYSQRRMCNGDKEGDIEKIKELSEHIKECAKKLDINIKWGGDWKNFKDYPHWELVE